MMRDYSKAAPTFWTGPTGRQIRDAGRDVQVVAFYLFTCPSSNWIGLYYLPIPTLLHEVGIARDAAMKSLRVLEEIDFAYYDEDRELVWVPGAARFQIAESLKASDNRVIKIVKDLQRCPNQDFVRDFIKRYSALFHLPEISLPDLTGEPLRRPSEGPPKPVTETGAGAEAGAGTEKLFARSASAPAKSPEIFTVLPCTGKQKEFQVTRGYIEEMKPLYPGVDIEKETLRAKGWLINNPQKRKTHQGMTKFLGGWYSREQDKNGKGGSNTKQADSKRELYPKYKPKDRPELPEV